MPIRFRVNHGAVRTHSIAEGVKLVREVTREIEIRAKINAFEGPYATGNLARHVTRRGPFITGSRVTGRVGVWGLAYASSAALRSYDRASQ